MSELYIPARARIHVRSSVSCGQLETFSQAGANIVLYRFMFLLLQSANHSKTLAFNVWLNYTDCICIFFYCCLPLLQSWLMPHKSAPDFAVWLCSPAMKD